MKWLEYLKANKDYFVYYIKHRYWIYKLGRMFDKATGMKLSWYRILVHDTSKLFPDEWFGYVHWKYKQMTEEAGGTEKNNRGYGKSWHLHYLRNSHHFQRAHYVDDQTGKCYPIVMELADANEMLVDWAAAGMVRFGEPGMRSFFRANSTIFYKLMHIETYTWVNLHVDSVDKAVAQERLTNPK